MCISPGSSQCNTLIRYLLDELYAYEANYSDTLAPIQQETDQSLAGEAALVRPMSTEELRMVHSSVMGDIQELQAEMGDIANSVQALMEIVGGSANDTSTTCKCCTARPLHQLRRAW
jgi:hypothetical protein